MILVLFFLGIIIILSFIILLILLSNLHLTIIWVSKNKFKFIIELYVFNKIKILKINLNNKKLAKINIKDKIKNIDITKLSENFKFDKAMIIDLKKLNIKIPKLRFNIKLGTEDAIVTSFLVCFISTIISLVVERYVNKFDTKKIRYNITPQYVNRNILKIKLNCIFNVKMVNIIYIIFSIFKKGRVNKYERASNRRTYDYSYGQH